MQSFFQSIGANNLKVPATGTTVTGNAVMPATALTGTTRMRVIYMEAPIGSAQVADPCVNVDIYNMPVTGTSRSMYGGAWDFNVNITSGGTAINELSGSNERVVYPNPAKETITISSTSTSQQGVITLYDITGKAVKAGVYKNGEAKLAVSDVPDGVYYLKENSEGKVLTEKVVVIH